ncbi:MAG: hypothetical protein M1594_02250 [Candidatus Marsarchaeota archaeon]|nr:hypothetical protein [Candidatus Marsarchaeota archaeon]
MDRIMNEKPKANQWTDPRLKKTVLEAVELAKKKQPDLEELKKFRLEARKNGYNLTPQIPKIIKIIEDQGEKKDEVVAGVLSLFEHHPLIVAKEMNIRNLKDPSAFTKAMTKMDADSVEIARALHSNFRLNPEEINTLLKESDWPVASRVEAFKTQGLPLPIIYDILKKEGFKTSSAIDTLLITYHSSELKKKLKEHPEHEDIENKIRQKEESKKNSDFEEYSLGD